MTGIDRGQVNNFYHDPTLMRVTLWLAAASILNSIGIVCVVAVIWLHL